MPKKPKAAKSKVTSKKKVQVTSASGPEVMSFEDAIGLAEGKKHLMLGNGFSIALFPDIFTYGTLFDKAKSSRKLTKKITGVFGLLETTDFEQVMEALQNAAKLMTVYAKKAPNLAKKLQADAEKLRDILTETISENHPERPHCVDETQYASCKTFLSNFDGSIYTLNYDLLLYWTLMQSEVQPDVKSDDGFRDVEEGTAEYVVWDVQNSGTQRIHYLHGALHVFDAGAELKKFVWSKTEIALVDQIRRSLASRHYPLIVTEGTSEQKMDRIQHSGFLSRAYRSLAGIGWNLFIYGHSLAENDEHLLKLIDHGKTTRIFVGLYGDPTKKSNQKIIERAKLIPGRRRDRYPAEVFFYDAQSARVWDKPSGKRKKGNK
jgi:hypothetical protein